MPGHKPRMTWADRQEDRRFSMGDVRGALVCGRSHGQKGAPMCVALYNLAQLGRNRRRYSLGVTPTCFLNTREKYCDEWKPPSIPMAVTESEVLVSFSQQRLMRSRLFPWRNP